MNIKQDIVITVTGVAQDLSADLTKFSALLDGTTDYNMKVNSVVFTANTHTITVRYPGADKGTYTVKVTHSEQGTLTEDQTLSVGAKITVISPTEGSLNGGTTVTITGENFSATKSDMLVKFGTIDCPIATATPTKITCVTSKSPKEENNALQDDVRDVAVIIKITEESTCGIGGGCNFNWKDTATPKVTAGTWTGDTLSLTGTNFGTTPGSVTVLLSGLA